MKAQTSTYPERKFINLIRDKCAGERYDVELYVNTMDKIMKKVYRDLGQVYAGFMGLDIDTFMNYCWSKLEDNKLVFKLADVSFQNDTHLLRYIRKVFENLLRERAGGFSPGFRARQKQMERVLKPLCIPSCRIFCSCWKLNEFRSRTCTPASLEHLHKAASTIAVPKTQIQKTPDARCPSIKDRDMGEYLKSLLLAVGGMARHKDMLAVVVSQLGVAAVRISQIPEDKNDPEPPSPGETLLSADHDAMARELLEGMTEDMIDIHYYRIARCYSIPETAKAMNKSVGTIHNREKSYKQYLMAYFVDGGLSLSTEEMNAVMALLTNQIIELKEAP